MSRFLLKVVAIIASISLYSLSFQAHAKNQLAVDRVSGDFSVMVLGSGGGVARPDGGGRAQPSLLVFIDGKPEIMIDAGGGSYERLAQSGVDIRDLKVVLLSHLHIDHTANLTGMIRTVYFEHAPGVNPGVEPRLIPLKIFGPGSNDRLVPGTNTPLFPTTTEYVERSYDDLIGAERYINLIFERDISQSNFEFDVTDVEADVSLPPRIIYNENGVLIRAIGVNHFTAPSLAYSIEYKGHKFTYSGDLTSTTDNLTRLARNSDVLVYDASVVDNTPSGFHTTPERIAEVTNAAGVDNLVLSNLSLFTDGTDELRQVRRLIRRGGYRGNLSVANDLTVLNIEEPKLAYEGYPYYSNYAPVQGRFMHYLDEGEGENTVVMLHGNPTSAYLYRNIIPFLAEIIA